MNVYFFWTSVCVSKVLHVNSVPHTENPDPDISYPELVIPKSERLSAPYFTQRRKVRQSPQRTILSISAHVFALREPVLLQNCESTIKIYPMRLERTMLNV